MVLGKQHVNGVDLYYEKTGTGGHAVLLFPGALGKYTNTPFSYFSYMFNVSDMQICFLQEVLGLILNLS